MIICNDEAKILYAYSGWPANVHDQRVWRNTIIAKNPLTYFSPREYILSDSALAPSNYVVPSFKAPPMTSLPEDQEHFNKHLASVRIKIEHVNGLLKGRFPILKNMNINIKKDKDVMKVVRVFMACCILHNFLHVPGELPHEFYESIIEDLIDEDDPEFTDDISVINWDNDSRRRSIMEFLLDYKY